MPRGHDNSNTGTDMLLGAGVVVAILFLLIAFKPEVFVIPWQAQKIAETAVLKVLPIPGKMGSDVDFIYEFLTNTPPTEVTSQNFSRIQTAIWKITRIPYAIIIVALGLIILQRKKFKTKHNQETLIAQESKNWPWIKRFKTVHPEKKDIADKVYGFRKKPSEFAKEHGLVKKMEFQQSAAVAVFSEQLGKQFNGFENMSVEIKRIVAVCFLRLHRKDKEAEAFIRDVSEASASEKWGKVDERSKEILATMANNSEIKSCVKLHAYDITLATALLEKARKGGVIPPNWFSWLKVANRTVWYALSDAGLSVASIEAAGIRSHYLLEIEVQRPVPKPYVDQACLALKKSLMKAGILDQI